jgi:hypothetical protein
MIAKNYFYLRKETMAMSEITNLVDQIIVDSLKKAKKVDLGTQESEYLLKDLQQLVKVKMDLGKLEQDEKSLDAKIKNDTEALNIRKEELNQKIKSDEEKVNLQREELNQKIKSDEYRVKIEKIRAIQEQMEKELNRENQSKIEFLRAGIDVVKTLVISIGTISIANGVFAVEENGVVRSKAFPLMGNLLGRIR